MIGLILFLMSLFAGLTILSVGFEIFGVAMDVFGPLITIGIFVYIIRLFTNKNKKTEKKILKMDYMNKKKSRQFSPLRLSILFLIKLIQVV